MGVLCCLQSREKRVQWVMHTRISREGNPKSLAESGHSTILNREVCWLASKPQSILGAVVSSVYRLGRS